MDAKITGLLVFKNEAAFFLKESVQSFLRLCDEVVCVDTGSTDNGVEILESLQDIRVKIVRRTQKKKYNKDYGDIRNWARQFCTGDYIFNFDADEVLDDDWHLIREQIYNSPDVDCWSIKGRHYYWHLNKEDAQIPEHWWMHRLFKNTPLIQYPNNKAHGLPFGFRTQAKINGTFIHHYGYCKNLAVDLWRYENNYGENNEIHTDAFLNSWLALRIFGTFPVKEINPSIHPQLIKDKFHLERLTK